MVAVNTINGVTYGFRLFGYLVGITILGLLPLGIGLVLFEGTPLLGVLLMVVGFLVFYAGTFGLVYKVIADAVSAGVRDVSPQYRQVAAEPTDDVDSTMTD